MFYDNGTVIDVAVLDMTDEAVLARFGRGVANVAALSLGLHYPTLASFPHVVLNGFKNLAAVAVQTEYDFTQVKKLKDFVKNPSAFSAPTSTSTSTAPPKGKQPPPPVEDKPQVDDKKDDDEPVAFDLFG